MIAIDYQNLECVKFFIEECNASVDGNNAYKGSPIFCAVYRNNLRIVNYLIHKGANINLFDKTTTPLIEACSNGNIEIVKTLVENYVDININDKDGNTCLIIACKNNYFHIAKYILMNNKNEMIDVNVKNKQNYTALYYCCITISKQYSQILDVIQILLQRNPIAGLDIIHAYGMNKPCVFYASLMGNKNIVEYVMSMDYYNNNFTIKDKVEIWELLGCSVIDEKNDIINGIKCWLTASKVNVYGELIDNTLSFLDFKNDDDIYKKSLNVREKILGPEHYLTKEYIKKRGEWYVSMGNINYGIKLLEYYIYMVQNYVDEKNISFTNDGVLKDINKNVFIYNMVFNIFELYIDEVTKINFCDMINILENLFLKHLQISRECGFEYNDIKIINRLINLCLMKIKENEQDFDITRFKKFIRKLVIFNPISNRGTLLHSILCRPINENSVDAVKLLLEAGSNPCAIDCDGNTPLHNVAFKIKKYAHSNTYYASSSMKFCPIIVDILLQNNAHFDAVNKYGENFSSIQNSLSINQFHYTSLQCLAARIVRKIIKQNRKDYDNSILPKPLCDFVNMH